MTATPFCPLSYEKKEESYGLVLNNQVSQTNQKSDWFASLHTSSVNKSCMSVRISVSHWRANEKYVRFAAFHKKERHNAIPMISNNKRGLLLTATLRAMLGSVRDTNRNEESFLGIWAYAKSIFTCLKRSIDLRNGLLFAMAWQDVCSARDNCSLYIYNEMVWTNFRKNIFANIWT